MNNVVAKSYWRAIKRKARTFASIPASQKMNVKMLAKSEVADGTITEEQYASYIGETYSA